jgi:hypothetical protein
MGGSSPEGVPIEHRQVAGHRPRVLTWPESTFANSKTPIRDHYKRDPQAAQIRLGVKSAQADLGDPLHCTVLPISASQTSWRSGAHPAVGGTGDVPCSGDRLLGALAACQETTIRMVAANVGIELVSLQVDIEADWDARGTLAMGD